MSSGHTLTLCDGHDSRERRHDEVLGLLRVVMGQAVDVGEGAHRGQSTPRNGDLPGTRQDSHHQRHSKGVCLVPSPTARLLLAGRLWGDQQSPLPRGERAAASLGHLQLPSPWGCRPWLGCLNTLLINSEAAAAGKDFAGAGFQLHQSTAPGHGTSRAFAILPPKSKPLPSGTAEDSQHSLTSHRHVVGESRKYKLGK